LGISSTANPVRCDSLT